MACAVKGAWRSLVVEMILFVSLSLSLSLSRSRSLSLSRALLFRHTGSAVGVLPEGPPGLWSHLAECRDGPLQLVGRGQRLGLWLQEPPDAALGPAEDPGLC